MRLRFRSIAGGVAVLIAGCAPTSLHVSRASAPAVAPAPVTPPDLSVTTDAQQPIPVIRGSYCWSTGGRGLCADSVAPPLLAQQLDAAEVPRETILNVGFANRPLDGSIQVRRWNGQGSEVVSFVRPGAFALPEEPGEYVYSVFARWPEGDGTWALRVRVGRNKR